MTTIRQPNFGMNSENKSPEQYAAMKLKLGVVLCFALSLQFSLPACANVLPDAHDEQIQLDDEENIHAAMKSKLDEGMLSVPFLSRIHHVDYERIKAVVMRDRMKEHATHVSISGESVHLGGTKRTRRELVSVPVSMADPSFFEYLAKFKFGTPPREFVGIVDTGSSLVWIACDPCVNCVPRPIFETGSSSSFKNLPCSSAACKYWNSSRPNPQSCPISGTCPFNITYLTGEATMGDLSSDVLTLTSKLGESESFPEFVFGCAHQTSDFPILPYPVVGLSTANLSLFGQVGPKVGNNTLAFCLGTYFEGNITELNIGGEAKEDLTFTPLVPSIDPAYRTNLTGISVDGTLLPIPSDAFKIQPNGSGSLVLDTGTSFSILLPEVYSQLRSAVDSRVTYPPGDGSDFDLDLCYNLTNATIDEARSLVGFPNITFHFPNLSLQLPGENSYVGVSIDSGLDTTMLVCLAMMPSDYDVTIFGNFQMQNFDFFIDPDNRRVGVKQGCSEPV